MLPEKFSTKKFLFMFTLNPLVYLQIQKIETSGDDIYIFVLNPKNINAGRFLASTIFYIKFNIFLGSPSHRQTQNPN